MEKLELDAKNIELLSDEELLNVCGGNSFPVNDETMTLVRKRVCESQKHASDCLKYDFCGWDRQCYHVVKR